MNVSKRKKRVSEFLCIFKYFSSISMYFAIYWNTSETRRNTLEILSNTSKYTEILGNTKILFFSLGVGVHGNTEKSDINLYSLHVPDRHSPYSTQPNVHTNPHNQVKTYIHTRKHLIDLISSLKT